MIWAPQSTKSAEGANCRVRAPAVGGPTCGSGRASWAL